MGQVGKIITSICKSVRDTMKPNNTIEKGSAFQ